MIRGISYLSAALLLVALPAAAQGNDPEELLRQAEGYYEQLEYEKALQTLIQVQAAPNVNPVQQARAYLYMGVCFTALGRARDAVLAFVEVLKRRPNFRMPDGVSPSIRAMFQEALKALNLPETPAPEKPRPARPQGGGADAAVQVKAPRQVTAGQPVELAIKLEDPDRSAREVHIRWRLRRGFEYSTIRLDHKPGASSIKGRIPATTSGSKSSELFYYVEVRDGEGRLIAHAGSEEEPRSVKLQAAKPKRSRLRWWLAAIGGAAVVAGGIVTAVLLTRDGPVAQPPGTADVTVILR